MSNTQLAHRWKYCKRTRALTSLSIGLVAGLLSLALRLKPMAPLVGWDVGAMIYVAWAFMTTFRLDCRRTAAVAASEDPARVGLDLVLIFSSIASLAAVIYTLVESGQAHGFEKTILVVVSVASVVLSWMLVHTIYTFVYARLYYDEPKGGIDFNCDEDPDYKDFAYLAFTLGMTYQVSDTSISSRRIRHAVIHHAAISYLFGTVILATTINFVAGLAK